MFTQVIMFLALFTKCRFGGDANITQYITIIIQMISYGMVKSCHLVFEKKSLKGFSQLNVSNTWLHIQRTITKTPDYCLRRFKIVSLLRYTIMLQQMENIPSIIYINSITMIIILVPRRSLTRPTRMEEK